MCDKLQWSSVGARRHYQLCWPTTVQFISLWTSTFLGVSWQHSSTIDMLWRNFLSPEFEAIKVPKVPLSLKVPEFPYNTVSNKAPVPKNSPIRLPVSIEHRLVTDTNRQTQGHSVARVNLPRLLLQPCFKPEQRRNATIRGHRHFLRSGPLPSDLK